jgi:CBS domain-containing protein
MSLTDPHERLEQLKVHDIMIPLEQYPQVSTKATLRDAVRVMDKAELNVGGRRSLPRVLLICSDDGGLEGLVRRRDVLHGLEPRFLDSEPLKYRQKPFDVGFDPHLSEINAERVIEGIRKRADRPVTEVMRPIKGAVDHEDSIITAFYEMTSLGVPMLPVERGGKPIGVVRTVEVFSELARLVN